jgi:hypothetical protein
MKVRVFDHQKVWRFSVAVSSDACQMAFEEVMTRNPSSEIRAVDWRIRRDMLRSPSGGNLRSSVATFAGRAGIAAMDTALFDQRANSAERLAISSGLTFIFKGAADGRTERLTKSGTVLGMTQDAGYFRSYMDADAETR